MLNNIVWHSKTFNKLSTNELYDILKLRIDVFVVEQTCFYSDLDDHDRHPGSIHCFAYHRKPNGEQEIVAYARILPKGTTYSDFISIGRVVTSPQFRAHKLGYTLMERTIKHCIESHPLAPIKISAQEHLKHFYQKLGFECISEMYLEDNIPHVAMMKDTF